MTRDSRDPGSLGRNPEAIEADIRRQREALSRTVDDLTAKLDVKTHAEANATELVDAATTDTGRPRPALVAAVVMTVAGVAALVWWRNRS